MAVDAADSAQGLHPRIVADGFDIAKKTALTVLDTLKLPRAIDRDALVAVARTSLRTKVPQKIADLLTNVRAWRCCSCKWLCAMNSKRMSQLMGFNSCQAVVDSILTIKRGDKPVDLFMIELQQMLHKTDTDTQCVHAMRGFLFRLERLVLYSGWL